MIMNDGDGEFEHTLRRLEKVVLLVVVQRTCLRL